MHQASFTRGLALRIANIKFDVMPCKSKLKMSADVLTFKNALIREETKDKSRQKETIVTRNCFIPKVSIRSQSQL